MRCKHAWYTYRFCENILLSGPVRLVWILEKSGWFGWMLDEFVREKHCSGWKNKRIKPDSRARERGLYLIFWYSYLMSHHQSEKVRLGRIFRYIALFADAEGSTILGLSHFWKIELKIASRSLLDRDLRAASCSSQCFLVIVCMLRLASVVYVSFLNLDNTLKIC